jgi:hypothetical protein
MFGLYSSFLDCCVYLLPFLGQVRWGALSLFWSFLCGLSFPCFCYSVWWWYTLLLHIFRWLILLFLWSNGFCIWWANRTTDVEVAHKDFDLCLPGLRVSFVFVHLLTSMECWWITHRYMLSQLWSRTHLMGFLGNSQCLYTAGLFLRGTCLLTLIAFCLCSSCWEW